MTKRFRNYLARQQGKILMALLGLVVVIFIGILVMSYIVAKRANPFLLLETGRPVNSNVANSQ